MFSSISAGSVVDYPFTQQDLSLRGDRVCDISLVDRSFWNHFHFRNSGKINSFFLDFVRSFDICCEEKKESPTLTWVFWKNSLKMPKECIVKMSKKSIAELDDLIVKNMPKTLYAFNSFARRWTPGGRPHKLEFQFIPNWKDRWKGSRFSLEGFPSFTEISDDFPHCLDQVCVTSFKSCIGGKERNLQDSFNFILNNLCEVKSYGECHSCCDRAFQRAQVIVVFIYLYNFIRMERVDLIESMLLLLEKMPIGQNNFPLHVKNLARSLYIHTYLAVKEQDELENRMHLDDLLSDEDFGKKVFTSNTTSVSFQRQMVDEFLTTLCALSDEDFGKKVFTSKTASVAFKRQMVDEFLTTLCAFWQSTGSQAPG